MMATGFSGYIMHKRYHLYRLEVLPRLEFGNATVVGLPQYLLRQLQFMMNAAARLIVSG
jgi:hypothetical protein